MAQDTPIINGFYHQFASIEADIGGTVFNGFTAIEYSDNMERGEARGAAPHLLGRTKGDYKLGDCSIELYRKQFKELLDQLGDNFYVTQFPVRVNYAEDGQPAQTDTLVRCRFSKREFSGQQGSDPLKITIGIEPEGILWNGRLPYTGFPR